MKAPHSCPKWICTGLALGLLGLLGACSSAVLPGDASVDRVPNDAFEPADPFIGSTTPLSAIQLADTPAEAIAFVPALPGESVVNAAFVALSWSDVTVEYHVTRSSECRLITSANVPSVPAGTLTVSSDDMTVSPTATRDGRYFDQRTTNRWMPGDALTIHTAGATVPSIDVIRTMPPAIRLQSPTVAAGQPILLPPTGDLAIAWDGAPPWVQVSIAVAPASAGALEFSLRCRFRGELGAGRVPASMLAMLPRTAAQTRIFIASASVALVWAGAYPVEVRTETVALAAEAHFE